MEVAGPSGIGSGIIYGFDGELGTFSGAFPIENLLRDLYAIETKWLQGY